MIAEPRWQRSSYRQSRWLAIAVLIAAGCNDLSSHKDSSELSRLTNETTAQESSSQATSANEAVPSTGDADRKATTVVAPHAANKPVANKPVAAPRSAVAPKESIAIPAAPPAEIYEPQVILSKSHQETCLVGVNDTMPNLELTRLAGESVSLNELRGQKLSVVVFCTNDIALSREQLRRLAQEVALPFRHLGVKVIAVNVGQPGEQIDSVAANQEDVVCLLDLDGSAVAKIAKSKLPRTYLIDGEGRILWFDVEYSRSTRRQLKNAIFYFSQDQANVAS